MGEVMRQISRSNYRAFLSVETAMGLMLLFGLAVISFEAVMRYRAAEEEAYWRRAAMLAADAQLKRYESGAALDSAPPAGVVAEEIKLETVHERGRETWTGLERVTVIAAASTPSGRTYKERLVAYMQMGTRP
jgi:hypothetical protein